MTPRPIPLLMLSLLLAGTASAETSPWYVGVSQTFTHEDNVYRLADGQATPAGVSKSDLISSTALLAGLDQPIGRQRLYGNATLRANRFQDNGLLDNEGYALNLGVDWETIGRLSGNFDFVANRNLARFNTDTELGLLTKKNIENTEHGSATVRLGVVTRYTAEASVSHRRVSYSAAEFDRRENDQTDVDVGLRYRPSGASMFGIGLRHVQGKYPRAAAVVGGGFTADEYTSDGLDLRMTIEPTGSSRIQARLTLGKTSFDRATQRDYSGATGAVIWDYDPGGRLRLKARLARDSGQDTYFNVNPFVDGFSDYSRTTTSMRLGAEYDLTGKIKVNAAVAHADRDLVETLVLGGLTPAAGSGSDRTTQLSLGATWAATRSLTVGCDLRHERRNASGTLSLPYRAASAGCYGQFVLN